MSASLVWVARVCGRETEVLARLDNCRMSSGGASCLDLGNGSGLGPAKGHAERGGLSIQDRVGGVMDGQVVHVRCQPVELLTFFSS